jgi:hypothetical protein
MGRWSDSTKSRATRATSSRRSSRSKHWRARIGDRDSVEPFDLRVTTTFRQEKGEWKIVHRHADPISTENESGPLRTA